MAGKADNGASQGVPKIYPDLPVDEEDMDVDHDEESHDSTNQEETEDKLYPDLGIIDGSDVQPESQKPKEQDKTGHIANWWWRGVFVLLVLAILAGIYYESVPAKQSNSFVDKKQFQENLEDLRSKFTHQRQYLWTSIGKLGADHIQEVQNSLAKRPLVFLLVGSVKNEKILNCMAKKIALTFSTERHSTPIDGNDIARGIKSKVELNAHLEDILNSSSNGKTVAIVTEIGSLSYEIASIFFKFCDTEGAPYPNAVFIFTLTLAIFEKTIKEINEATWHYLRHVVWKDGQLAQIDALIARVVDPAPIPVFNEEETVLNTCPKT